MIVLLVVFAVLALNIWAILAILRSSEKTGTKILWILLVLFIPIIGSVAWYLVGPKG